MQKLCPIHAEFSEVLLVVLKHMDEAWDPILANSASDTLHLPCLSRLFCLEVHEPLRNRERQFIKQTSFTIHEVAVDVLLYSFKETRSHGLLQSKHRCSFGWSKTGLPHQASCDMARHSPSPMEHTRRGSALCVEVQQGSYLELGRNFQAAVLFLLSRW